MNRKNNTIIDEGMLTHKLCPVKHFMEIISSKWKSSIICILSDGQSHRYGRIHARIPGVTKAMLSTSLKQLESDGIINRVSYNQIPPRVEYSLTSKGISLLPIIESMAKWSLKNMPSNTSAFCKECKGK